MTIWSVIFKKQELADSLFRSFYSENIGLDQIWPNWHALAITIGAGRSANNCLNFFIFKIRRLVLLKEVIISKNNEDVY